MHDVSSDTCGEARAKPRRVPSFATREQDGFVWVYATPDAEPAREPYRFPHVGDTGLPSASVSSGVTGAAQSMDALNGAGRGSSSNFTSAKDPNR